ncbi:hypothetical protein ABIA33_005101 [Streptacidiphilus sp. MAP12-16]
MNPDSDFDVVVLGAGPGGYVAAIAAPSWACAPHRVPRLDGNLKGKQCQRGRHQPRNRTGTGRWRIAWTAM